MRKYSNEKGELYLGDGDYGKDPRDGIWYARPPGMDMGSLKNHEVVEYDDGTITVLPSILVTEYDGDCEIKWHGYLERGMWIVV